MGVQLLKGIPMSYTAADLESATAKLAKVELTEAETEAVLAHFANDDVQGFATRKPQGLFSLFGTMVRRPEGAPADMCCIEMTPYD